MKILNIHNYQTKRSNFYSKIKFGNNIDPNREFNSIISSFPDVKDNNPSRQEELEYDNCYRIIKNYLINNGSKNINLGNSLNNLACKGHYKIVELLIKEYDADVNYSDIMGSTPIMYASMNGHTKTIEMLGKYGAEINKKNDLGYNAVMLAAMNNHTSAIDKIIGINPVNINDTDNSGRTALALAVTMENKEAVKKLISYNADLNIKNSSGETALMAAASSLNRELVNLLIEAGADTEAKDNFGSTADARYQYTLGMISLKIATGDRNIDTDLLKRAYSQLCKK